MLTCRKRNGMAVLLKKTCICLNIPIILKQYLSNYKINFFFFNYLRHLNFPASFPKYLKSNILRITEHLYPLVFSCYVSDITLCVVVWVYYISYSTTGYTASGLCSIKRRWKPQIYLRHFVRFSDQNFVILRHTDLKYHRHKFRDVKYWELRSSGLLCGEWW